MAKDLKDLIKKLDELDNLADRCKPKLHELFRESVSMSLIDFYNSYDPKEYERTHNFLDGVYKSAKTDTNKNIITFSVDSSYMGGYNGWSGHNYLDPSKAYDMFFERGQHGSGRWLMKTSIPPFMQVDDDINDAFGGRATKILNDEIKNILK